MFGAAFCFSILRAACIFFAFTRFCGHAFGSLAFFAFSPRLGLDLGLLAILVFAHPRIGQGTRTRLSLFLGQRTQDNTA